MSDLTISHIALYAVLIVIASGVIARLESRRIRIARACRERREPLDARPGRKAA